MPGVTFPRCDTIAAIGAATKTKPGGSTVLTVDLALYQPDIAQNAGTLLRLGACLGIRLHIVQPAGFPFSPRTVRRAALDYLEHAHFLEHDSYDHFSAWRAAEGRRLVLLTTHASTSIYDSVFAAGDVLMLGRESAGVPESVAAGADLRVRIPMQPDMRSLNVAVAGAIVLGEALRQTGHFQGLS